MAKELPTECRFNFSQLVLKEQIWTVKMVLKLKLKKVFSLYTVRLILDQEPFEKNIEEAEKRLEKVESGNLTIDGSHKDAVKDAKDAVIDAKAALKEAIEEYEDIEFIGVTEEVKYKVGETHFTMVVAADVVDQIDKHKADLMPGSGQRNMYKIELTKREDASI